MNNNDVSYLLVKSKLDSTCLTRQNYLYKRLLSSPVYYVLFSPVYCSVLCCTSYCIVVLYLTIKPTDYEGLTLIDFQIFSSVFNEIFLIDLDCYLLDLLTLIQLTRKIQNTGLYHHDHTHK